MSLEQKQLLFMLNLNENEITDIFYECGRMIYFNKTCMSCKYFDKCNELRQKTDNLSFYKIMKNWKS